MSEHERTSDAASAAEDMSDLETKQRTVDACAWLFPIAEVSVDRFGWDPSIVRWLDHLGEKCSEELQRFPRH